MVTGLVGASRRNLNVRLRYRVPRLNIGKCTGIYWLTLRFTDGEIVQ